MPERDKDRIKNIVSSVAEALDIPQDVTGSIKLTLWGQDLLRLENHQGIIGYSSDLIICAAAEGRVEISGRGLRLGVLESDELWIEGHVEGIALIEKDS